MKHNKLTRWAALILAAALTLSLTACGGAGGSSSAGSASASQSAPASAITLTDQAGRQVELDAPADTLVSCYYVTTYATMALGISDRVVGLEKKADTRPIYAMAAPDLLEKEQVGTMKELDLEAVAALEPDLVVMPKKLMDYAAPLEELGIPVLVVNPESHEALTGMLELLGQACGVEGSPAGGRPGAAHGLHGRQLLLPHRRPRRYVPEQPHRDRRRGERRRRSDGGLLDRGLL